MTPGGRRRPFIRQVQSPNRQGLAEEAGDVVPGPQHGADSVGTVLPGTLTPLPPSFAARGLSWLLHPRPVLRLAPPPTQGIATGKYHAAVLTNSAEWEAACVKAGRRCGDLVHPLVYCPELHFSEFTSAVADMKNSVAVGVQGA